jgi:type IV pilus assembly protein PilF
METLGKRASRWAGAVLVLALVLAGCISAPQNATGPGPQATDQQLSPQVSTAYIGPNGELLLGERRDARTRAAAHTELAGAYFQRAEISVAIEEVKLALAADPDYEPAHNLMGLIHMELKQLPEAEASFRRALQIDPRDSDANHNLGQFLCQNGREADGVKYFLIAVQDPLYRSAAKSYAAAGSCALTGGQRAEALEYYGRALRLDRNYVPAMLPYAQLQFDRGGLDEAFEVVRRLNTISTPSAQSLWLLARIERRRGDAAAERAALEQLRQRFPQSAEWTVYQRGAPQ